MKTAIEYADEDDLDIYTICNFTEYKTLDDMNKNYTNENSNIIIDILEFYTGYFLYFILDIKCN